MLARRLAALTLAAKMPCVLCKTCSSLSEQAAQCIPPTNTCDSQTPSRAGKASIARLNVVHSCGSSRKLSWFACVAWSARRATALKSPRGAGNEPNTEVGACMLQGYNERLHQTLMYINPSTAQRRSVSLLSRPVGCSATQKGDQRDGGVEAIRFGDAI